jgi:1-deoxy-D-xylulose-5-phosphate synthase
MELKMAFDYAYSLDAPCAIRYPKGTAEKSQLDNYHPDIGKNPSVVVKSGGETLVIVVGPFVSETKKAVENLDAEIGIVYLRVLKPLPEKDLLKIISSYKNVLIIEENVFSGSASEEIAALILQNGLSINFSSINIPDKFIEHDTRDNILSALGFDAAGIKRALQKMNAAKMLHKRAI